MQWLANTAANLTLAGVERDVAQVLQAAGLGPVVPIKGNHWQHTVWQALPGVRPMVDVDLLLTKQAFLRVPQVLARQSHWQLQAPLPRLRARWAADQQLRVGEVSVELKRHVLLRPVVDLRPLLARAQPAPDSPALHLLRPADALLVDLLHHVNDAIVRQHWNPRHVLEFQVLLAQWDRPADFADHCAAHGVLHWLALWTALSEQVLARPVWQQPRMPLQPELVVQADGRIAAPPQRLVQAWLYRRHAPLLWARDALLWLPKRVRQNAQRAT